MFDLDASKIVIVGVAALIFIPPKDLPRVMRQVGQFVGKMRRMAGEFQGQFMDAMREADMADLREEARKLSDAARFDTGLNSMHDIDRHMRPLAAHGVVAPGAAASGTSSNGAAFAGVSSAGAASALTVDSDSQPRSPSADSVPLVFGGDGGAPEGASTETSSGAAKAGAMVEPSREPQRTD